MMDWYAMKLCEVFIGNDVRIDRVPGGWIYSIIRLDQNVMTSVFVPYTNEFDLIPESKLSGAGQ